MICVEPDGVKRERSFPVRRQRRVAADALVQSRALPGVLAGRRRYRGRRGGPHELLKRRDDSGRLLR